MFSSPKRCNSRNTLATRERTPTPFLSAFFIDFLPPQSPPRDARPARRRAAPAHFAPARRPPPPAVVHPRVSKTHNPFLVYMIHVPGNTLIKHIMYTFSGSYIKRIICLLCMLVSYVFRVTHTLNACSVFCIRDMISITR